MDRKRTILLRIGRVVDGQRCDRLGAATCGSANVGARTCSSGPTAARRATNLFRRAHHHSSRHAIFCGAGKWHLHAQRQTWRLRILSHFVSGDLKIIASLCRWARTCAGN